MAIETLGAINSEGTSFLEELGSSLSIAAHDTREATFLYQRVSVCIQRANAIAFGLFCGEGFRRLEADSTNYFEALSHGLICLSPGNVVPG